MVNCTECGNDVEDGAKFCKNCGAEIVVEEEPQETKEYQFCSNCGFKMDANIKFCPECGASTSGVPQPANATAVANSDKNPVLAAILSFLIVGVGQIYLGLTKKGLILLLAAIISGVLMLVFIGFITWFIVWIYAIYDAYNSAEKMNRGIAVEDKIDFQNLF